MTGSLVFLAWHRSGVYSLATTSNGPRLTGTLNLRLRDRDNPNVPPAEGAVDFEIMGPGDVRGLASQAIRRTYPVQDAVNVESPKSPYVELAAPDLPWRYTPETKSGQLLRPWIVVVVGASDGEEPEIELRSEQRIWLGPGVTENHDLDEAAAWAHIQIGLSGQHENLTAATPAQLESFIASDGGTPLARLLSLRTLLANREHIAAVVPAFNPDTGESAWQPGDQIELPVYHHWRFRTGEEGDFRTLAARLRAEPPPEELNLGRAPLVYEFIFDETHEPEDLSVRGALTTVGSADEPIPTAIQEDVAKLTTPLTDERGRPILAPPVYGAAWTAAPKDTKWGELANADPRHRGSAGLGVGAGIFLQNEIFDTVRAQAGAVAITNQRINQLALGVMAAESLWGRRLPQDPMRRLQLFGPTLRRMMTPDGPVLDQIAGGDRPLAPGIFSSAARRIFRPGPARTALAKPGAADIAKILPLSNTSPSTPERAPAGAAHTDHLDRKFKLPSLEELIGLAVEREALSEALLEGLIALVEDLFEYPPDQFYRFVIRLRRLGCLNYAGLMDIITAVEKEPFADILIAAINAYPMGPEYCDGAALLEFGEELLTPPPIREYYPIDLLKLAQIMTLAFDPTGPNAWIKERVLSNIEGLMPPFLAPVEICTGVDLPLWRFLRDKAPDWLLPGVGQLEPDHVYAFESNPAFIDTFLLGANTQTLSELRWRNLPIATGCTPLKMFWGRTNPGGLVRQNDLKDVTIWPPQSDLGHPTHQPDDVKGTNLVLVIRSDLFRRYPNTLVSALRAPLVNESPNFDTSPSLDGDTDRIWPVFQGSIGEDVTFFGFPLTPQEARACWLILEEPPSGYHFRSDYEAIPVDPASLKDGADYAAATLNEPTRVLIRGDWLILD